MWCLSWSRKRAGGWPGEELSPGPGQGSRRIQEASGTRKPWGRGSIWWGSGETWGTWARKRGEQDGDSDPGARPHAPSHLRLLCTPGRDPQEFGPHPYLPHPGRAPQGSPLITGALRPARLGSVFHPQDLHDPQVPGLGALNVPGFLSILQCVGSSQAPSAEGPSAQHSTAAVEPPPPAPVRPQQSQKEAGGCKSSATNIPFSPFSPGSFYMQQGKQRTLTAETRGEPRGSQVTAACQGVLGRAQR